MRSLPDGWRRTRKMSTTANPAAQSKLIRLALDEIAKAHPLDVAAHDCVQPLHVYMVTDAYLEHRGDRRRAGRRIHARHELPLDGGAPPHTRIPGQACDSNP